MATRLIGGIAARQRPLREVDPRFFLEFAQRRSLRFEAAMQGARRQRQRCGEFVGRRSGGRIAQEAADTFDEQSVASVGEHCVSGRARFSMTSRSLSRRASAAAPGIAHRRRVRRAR